MAPIHPDQRPPTHLARLDEDLQRLLTTRRTLPIAAPAGIPPAPMGTFCHSRPDRESGRVRALPPRRIIECSPAALGWESGHRSKHPPSVIPRATPPCPGERLSRCHPERSRGIWRRMTRASRSQADFSVRPPASVEMTCPADRTRGGVHTVAFNRAQPHPAVAPRTAGRGTLQLAGRKKSAKYCQFCLTKCKVNYTFSMVAFTFW